MKKQKNSVVDKEQYKEYKQYLIDEAAFLRNENDKLVKQLSILQIKYNKIIEVQETEDCYTCVCGIVTQCNCKHLGYLKQELNRIDLETLNNLWSS